MARVCGLLCRTEVRLLTLTGPGGVGKTRLGQEVAATLQDTFAEGVSCVSLAPLSDPALVARTIAQSLAVKEAGGQTLLEGLRAHLHAKQVLLLLDNFEHVLAAAPLVADLLAACPQLKVLVTSRAALHLRSEQEVPVAPLAVPDLHYVSDVTSVARCAAVSLFVQRA